jgi:hypothetical protein
MHAHTQFHIKPLAKIFHAPSEFSRPAALAPVSQLVVLCGSRRARSASRSKPRRVTQARASANGPVGWVDESAPTRRDFALVQTASVSLRRLRYFAPPDVSRQDLSAKCDANATAFTDIPPSPVPSGRQNRNPTSPKRPQDLSHLWTARDDGCRRTVAERESPFFCRPRALDCSAWTPTE